MSRKSLFASLVFLALLALKAAAQSIVFTTDLTSFNSGGGIATFTATISYDSTPSTLSFLTTLPTGWSYVGGSGEPSAHPLTGATGTLNWTYPKPPSDAASFTFTASYPGGLTGLQPFSTSAVTRSSTESPPTTTSGPTLTLAAPAARFVWNGDPTTHDGTWTDATKWSPAGTVPNNKDLATYAVELSQGVVSISTGTAITLNDIFLFGGSINGGGLLTVIDVNSKWTSGSISGLGVLSITSGAAFTASTYNAHDFDRTVILNSGTFNWTDGGSLRSGNGGSFVNAPGAKFIDTTSGRSADYLITNGFGGTSYFFNAGTYIKSTTGSTTRIELPFYNSGTVQVDGGTLHFTSSFTQAGGTINAGAGTTTIFDNGLALTDGTLIGAGTVTGNVTVGIDGSSHSTGKLGSSAISLSSVATLSPGNPFGQMTIQGNLTLLQTSQFLIDLGGPSQGVTYDFLSISGNASLGGEITVTFQNNFNQTVNAGHTFTLLSATSLTGTFDNAPNGTRLFTSDGSGSFLVNYSPTSVVLSNYQVVPVPEPSTWALMIAGLGLIGVAAWRRRQA